MSENIKWPRVFIDATDPGAGISVFSISLCERNLRLLAACGLSEADVFVTEASRKAIRLRRDFGRFKKIETRFHIVSAVTPETIKRLEPDANRAILLMEANAVYQDSLVRTLTESASDLVYFDRSRTMPVLAKIRRATLDAVGTLRLGEPAAMAALKNNGVALSDIQDLLFYVPSQRKRQHPYAFHIVNADQAHEAERFLFEITHYGSIDIVAKYFLKHLSRFLVSLFAKTEITPNQITYVSILVSAAVSPLFALGYLIPGVACAVTVSILDVCDGKLARFTYRTSDRGDLLDHIADRVNIYLYYITFGIGLWSAGFVPNVWTAAAYVGILLAGHTLDRIVVRWFRLQHGMRIHDYAEIDVFSRLFLPRRNIFICFVTIGSLFGMPVHSYLAYTIWMFLYAVFHFGRVIAERPKAGSAQPSKAAL